MHTAPSPQVQARTKFGVVVEVFLTFLRLGLTAFGGPVAHLGYFRRRLVEQEGWVSEAVYADLVALAQFLPGPASSQVGFSLGVLRAGLFGGLAAWLGFTLPSAALLYGFAYLQPMIAGSAFSQAVMHGLKLVAVAVVAQAVLGMARTLCPDRQRASIAVGAVVAVLLLPAAFGQVSAIAVGAIAGLVFCRKAREPVAEIELGWVAPRGLSLICLILFVVLFAPGGAWLQAGGPAALFHGLYRTGALVFGGGHVVLPLLRQQVVAPGWVSDSQFLAGYGAAQATPGPLFAFAAYLGAVSKVGGGPAGATIALIGIFLPGLLLMLAALPHWRGFRRHSAAQAAMQGVNASVVGILALALYDPVWIGAVHSNADFAIAAIGFILLVAWDAPPLLVVALSVAAAAMTAAI